MSTKLERVDEKYKVKRYKIQYPLSAYTFPLETRIQAVRFDDKYIHVELTDGRIVSVPLAWIPTVQNAVPAEREKYQISHNRTMIVWDPDQCAINDELRISDYMQPTDDAEKIVAEKKSEYRTKPTVSKRTAGVHRRSKRRSE